MALNEIIAIADGAYPDGLVGDSWDPDSQRAVEGAGDTLALFIVRELADTYDDSASGKEQLEEAQRVILRARQELEEVDYAFRERLNEVS